MSTAGRRAGMATMSPRGVAYLVRPICSYLRRGTLLALTCGFGSEHPAVPKQRAEHENTQSLHRQLSPCHTDAPHLAEFDVDSGP